MRKKQGFYFSTTFYSLKGNLRCLHFNYYILSRIKRFPLIHGNILVQIILFILMFIYSTFESLLLQIININMLIGKFTDH